MQKRALILALSMLAIGPLVTRGQEPPPAAGEAGGEEHPLRRQETVVVTASKTEQLQSEAAATISVLERKDLDVTTSQNVGEALRSVPGMNVAQLSAREFQVVGRQATGTLQNSQLVLVDGRTVYLDFFGLVLWDFVPADLADIERVEVVHGPASVVWGANAMTGVVNVLTRAPRDSVGESLTLSGGLFGRGVGSTQGEGPGKLGGLSARLARAPSERLAYRIAAGIFASDPLPRPTGIVPTDRHPLLDPETDGGAAEVGGGVFAPFENRGTFQPKLDLRIDQTLAGGGRLTYSAGAAGSEGIVHAGIGPFDMKRGSAMGYARVAYDRDRLRVSAFVNRVDARATNLQTVDAATGEPVKMNFRTNTWDLELGYSRLLGRHQLLSGGGNARYNTFDITLAPAARNRFELGAYLQDEAFVGPLRLAAGLRLDKFGNLADPVLSPRLALTFTPAKGHGLRLSLNRAFRSPSAVNNAMDLTITGVELPGATLCFMAPQICSANPALGATTLRLGPRSMGSDVASEVSPAVPALSQESLTAYEAAYTGRIGTRTQFGLAAYVNDTDDNVNFVADDPTLAAAGLPTRYSSAHLPPGWPLAPELADAPELRVLLDQVPASAAYLNLGPIRQRGLELWARHDFSERLWASVNYSWQDEPRPLAAAPGQIAFPVAEIQLPPSHRLNATVGWSTPRVIGSLAAHHVSRAFWNDVLPQLGFDGFTDAYTLVNLSLGLKWAGGKASTTVKVNNVLGQDVRQHIFADILKRGVTVELRLAR